jgi:hypothetical protein
VRS